MELSWSTFVLEVINFLVLVWILKHFLYKPVLSIIAQRRAGIENLHSEAQQLHDNALTLKQQYEGRLAEWDRERQQARDALAQELDEERQRQLSALKISLAQEQEKNAVLDSRRRKEALHETEQRALQQASDFASRLLRQAAGPELEARLIALLIKELSTLSTEQVAALKHQWGETPTTIHVSSAYALSTEQQQQIETSLLKCTGLTIPVAFEQDATLLAGLHITIGAWALHTNLREDLKGFAEFAHAIR